MLQAIIFDFDGVIVDSEPLHYRAFLETAMLAGLDISFDYETYLQRYVGFDDRDGFKAILSDVSDQFADSSYDAAALVAQLCEDKQDVFNEIVAEGVEPVHGVLALLEELPREIPVAIASGATRQDIKMILQALGLTSRFPVIVTADDVAKSKPNPETYQLAYEALLNLYPDADLRVDCCLAIEDTSAGIEAARGAGLQTVGITTTTSAENLHAAGRVIDTFEGVTFEVLNKWFG
jgi:beta-phosphoglucomutase